MTLVSLAAEIGAGLRWHVYRRPIRDPRNGETTADVHRWFVRPYMADTAGENRVYVGDAISHRSLGAAHLYARNQCRRFYRRTTR